MFCRICGKTINDNSKFCEYCGTSVENAGPSALDQSQVNVGFFRSSYLSQETKYFTLNLQQNKYFPISINIPKPYLFESIVGTNGRYGMPVACASLNFTERASFFLTNPLLDEYQDLTPFLGPEFGGTCRDREYDISSATIAFNDSLDVLLFTADRRHDPRPPYWELFRANLKGGTVTKVSFPGDIPPQYVRISGYTNSGLAIVECSEGSGELKTWLVDISSGEIKDDESIQDSIEAFLNDKTEGGLFYALHHQGINPKSDEIFFYYKSREKKSIAALDMSTGQIHDVFGDVDFYHAVPPAVSPDGERLLFSADINDGKLRQDGDPHVSLFISGTDGSNLVKMVDFPAKTIFERHVEPEIGNITWLDTSETLLKIESKLDDLYLSTNAPTPSTHPGVPSSGGQDILSSIGLKQARVPCPNCGKQVLAGAIKCSKCKQPLEPQAQTSSAVQSNISQGVITGVERGSVWSHRTNSAIPLTMIAYEDTEGEQCYVQVPDNLAVFEGDTIDVTFQYKRGKPVVTRVDNISRGSYWRPKGIIDIFLNRG